MSAEGKQCSVVECTSPVISLVRCELFKILHSIASMKKIIQNDEVETIVDQALHQSRLSEALRELFTGMYVMRASSERRKVLTTVIADDSDCEDGLDVIREIVRQIIFEQIDMLYLRDETSSATSAESSVSSIHSVTRVRTQHMLRNVVTLRMTTDHEEDSEASNSQVILSHEKMTEQQPQMDKQQDFISQIVQTHLKRQVFSKIDASTSMGKYVKVRSETEIAEIYTQTEEIIQLTEPPQPLELEKTKANNNSNNNMEKMLKKNFKRKPDPKHIEKLTPNMKPLQLELLYKDYFAVLLDEVTMLLRYSHYLSRKACSDVLSHREKDEARRKLVQLEVVRSMLLARKVRFFAHVLSALEYNIKKMKSITEPRAEISHKKPQNAQNSQNSQTQTKTDNKTKISDMVKSKAKITKKKVTQKSKTKTESVKIKIKPTQDVKLAVEDSPPKHGKSYAASTEKQVEQKIPNSCTPREEKPIKGPPASSPIVIERFIEAKSDRRTEEFDEKSQTTKRSVIFMPLPFRSFSLKAGTIKPEINSSAASSVTTIGKPTDVPLVQFPKSLKSDVEKPQFQITRPDGTKEINLRALWRTKISKEIKITQPECHKSLLRKSAPLQWTKNQKLDAIAMGLHEPIPTKPTVRKRTSSSAATTKSNRNTSRPNKILPRSEAINRLLAGALSSKSSSLAPALVNLERFTTRSQGPRSFPTKIEHTVPPTDKITTSVTIKPTKAKQIYKDEKFIPEEELLSLQYRKPTRKYLKKYEGLPKKSTLNYEYQHSTLTNNDTILPSLLTDSKVFRKLSTEHKQPSKCSECTVTRNIVVSSAMSDIPENSVPTKWYKYTPIINRLPPPPTDPNRWQLLKWNCSDSLKYIPSMDDVFAKAKAPEKHTSRGQNKLNAIK